MYKQINIDMQSTDYDLFHIYICKNTGAAPCDYFDPSSSWGSLLHIYTIYNKVNRTVVTIDLSNFEATYAILKELIITE